VTRHHPSDTSLLTYAAGTILEPHARVVAAHLSFCPDCAHALRLAEAVGGALLIDLPPSRLAPDALESTLDLLDAPPAEEPRPAPATLAGLATRRWRWAGPGVAIMPLLRRDACDSRLDLIRVAPGTALLEHGHAGHESTCILQGAFHDGVGEYRAGDFMEADGDFVHRPTALAGDPCICLIATSGRLQPRGLLGRLVRPLLGM
jgi:putative transcriptional regulator